MIYFVSTDENGRIWATTTIEEYAAGMEPFEFPEGFDFAAQNEYRIVDGELVHDPLPEPTESLIAALKAKLGETDYIVIKMAEAGITGAQMTKEDNARYAAIIEQRRAWREEINSLEGGGE